MALERYIKGEITDVMSLFSLLTSIFMFQREYFQLVINTSKLEIFGRNRTAIDGQSYGNRQSKENHVRVNSQCSPEEVQRGTEETEEEGGEGSG